MTITDQPETPDWTRERCRRFWDPPRRLLASIRSYQRLQESRGPLAWVRARVCVLRHRFWSVVCAADIPLNCRIGGGLAMPHSQGVVVHPGARLGANCLLLQQVTICDGVIVGDRVDFGAGAKVVRTVSIGAGARIGANAVVLEDVPAGATAVGVPARIVKRGSGPVCRVVGSEASA